MSSYGLGIDAGGTYTDLAIIDFTNDTVIYSTKELTNYDKPHLAISAGLEKIEKEVRSNIMVSSLATTLATNAIIENKGGKAGLVLIGCERVPDEVNFSTSVLTLQGGHTVSGSEKQPLNFSKLKHNIETFSKGIDAIAVVSFFSVRNPDHELKVAKFIEDKTGLTVICGHTFSMKLNFEKRAVTALWNARLIPLIEKLVQSTTKVLRNFNIKGPLMIVKGDGSLMSAKTALERPVETLLSGPAASINGARHISSLNDALVVDMGGTTTDIALIQNSQVKINSDGVTIGNWKTHVRSADIRTIGVGGDSLIWLDRDEGLSVGPLKAEPLCMAAIKDTRVESILQNIKKKIDQTRWSNLNPTTLYLEKPGEERKLLPHSPYSEYLQKLNKNKEIGIAELDKLVNSNSILQCSLTPTDILVALGEMELGSVDAARLGLDIFTTYLEVDINDLWNIVQNVIGNKICIAAVNLLCEDCTAKQAISNLVNYLYVERSQSFKEEHLKAKVDLTFPVIGLGAPAPAFVCQALELFTKQCYLFDDYDTSVAIGAIVGLVKKEAYVKIRFSEQGKYTLHSEKGRKEFSSQKEAVLYGKTILKELIATQMKEENIYDYHYQVDVNNKSFSNNHGNNIIIETDLNAYATSNIKPDSVFNDNNTTSVY